MKNNWERAAREEHLFWLQILGDHARFIHDTLAPSETDYIAAAQGYADLFDQLLERVRNGGNSLEELTVRAEQAAKDIRFLKLQIIRTQLTGRIKIELTPTFINHMVNEVEEYLRILAFLIRKEVPPVCHPLHHHLIWLIDAAGHAGAITDSLDKVETALKERSKMFEKDFDHFYLKAVEMAGYLRSNVDNFPALQRMNHQVSLELHIFSCFLNELEEMGLTREMLGTLTPLMADHMAREECYYLMKVAESAHLQEPDCDPAKPRVES
ncbi:DUF2935 domain-containing protein [Alteribacillus bidgolensis]|uniref:DUF2935 domain-containing protein n=1 Tax=Alteribacillus bidgolensis TaxID=930129 RepID=A0A1G8IGW0_9BACI|nr:DUF2935 domain-containing protein [Alteribacillus bidgolensis]SDI17991.1 protein of unknown function [Alteribacillus bidgolensis]